MTIFYRPVVLGQTGDVSSFLADGTIFSDLSLPWDGFMLHVRILIVSSYYESISSLAKSIPNMVYYCKHNKCQSRIKCAIVKDSQNYQ